MQGVLRVKRRPFLGPPISDENSQRCQGDVLQLQKSLSVPEEDSESCWTAAPPNLADERDNSFENTCRGMKRPLNTS